MKTMLTLGTVLAFAATSMADDKKAPEAKKEAQPEAKKEAKKEGTKEAPKPDAKAWEAPKPAAELTDMGKLMAGTWKCSGKAMDPAAGMIEFKGMTIKSKMDLDKFWIKNDMAGQMGPMKMKGTEYITYDASAKKWQRLSMDNTGGWETNTSSDGKKWDGDMRMMGMSAKTKANVEVTAKELKITAEMSMDGKKWMTGFEMACKK